MKKILFILILILLSVQSWASELELLYFKNLPLGLVKQDGKIPIFESLFLSADVDTPTIRPAVNALHMHSYDPNLSENLVAIIDNQLVVFPKDRLEVSEYHRPFVNIIDDSSLMDLLIVGQSAATWTDYPLAGPMQYQGFLDVKKLHNITPYMEPSFVKPISKPLYRAMTNEFFINLNYADSDAVLLDRFMFDYVSELVGHGVDTVAVNVYGIHIAMKSIKFQEILHLRMLSSVPNGIFQVPN